MFARLFVRIAAPASASILAIALATVVIRVVDVHFGPQHLVFVYILPITLIAFRFGPAAAIMTAIASALCAEFFVYPPKFSLYVAKPLHVAELIFFVVLSVATTQFVAVLAEEKRRGAVSARPIKEGRP